MGYSWLLVAINAYFDGHFHGEVGMVIDGHRCLAGWWLTYPSGKMMEFVSWDGDIPNIWKNKTCSKPPTRVVPLEWLWYLHYIPIIYPLYPHDHDIPNHQSDNLWWHRRDLVHFSAYPTEIPIKTCGWETPIVAPTGSLLTTGYLIFLLISPLKMVNFQGPTVSLVEGNMGNIPIIL